jgi:hypothetical protein
VRRSAKLTDFINAGEDVVADLHEDLKRQGKAAFYVSDVTDPTGAFQYVDLVQEGGGMLGIALLGYTYVLERLGIRFLNVAGTSAGAINTMMLSAIQSESVADIKSPVVLHYLSQKNLFQFVDGHPIARWLIRNIVKYDHYAPKTANSILFTLCLGLLLLVVSSLLLWNNAASVLALSVWVLLAIGVGGVVYKRARFGNGIINRFMQERDFLKLLGGVLVLILVCWGLQLSWAIPYRNHIEGILLLLVLLYAGAQCFSKRYMPSIQIAIAVVLLIILVLWGLNRSDTRLAWFYDQVAATTPMGQPGLLTPYAFLSIAGVSVLLFFALFIGSLILFLLARFNGSQFGINPARTSAGGLPTCSKTAR